MLTQLTSRGIQPVFGKQKPPDENAAIIKNAKAMAQHDMTSGHEGIKTYDALRKAQEPDEVARIAHENDIIFPITEFPDIEEHEKDDLLSVALNRALMLFKSALRFTQWHDELENTTSSRQIVARKNLAVTYWRLNDDTKVHENYHEAIKLARGLAENNQHVSHQKVLFECLDAYINYLVQKDGIDVAEPLMDEAFEIAKNVNSPNYLASSHRLKGQYHQQTGNYYEANEAYEKAVAIDTAKANVRKKCLSTYANFLEGCLGRGDMAEELRETAKTLK